MLGALIAGGATFLTGKLADDRARQAERKEHVARVGAEFLREADRVEQYLLDYVHEHAAVPGDNEEWGETAELARIAWELRLFAPRPVNDAAAELVDVLEACVASFAWWRGFCSAPWRSCCRDHAGLAAGRCRGLNREGCARSGPFGSLPLRQSPKAPPLTRITMPRPMRTMGKRMCSQRSSTSAIGGRVATNFARATRTATSARKTMQ